MSKIDDIKSSYDLLEEVQKHVTLSKKGNVYWGCCPFHGEKIPSFKVSPDIGKYKCHGCGEHGDVIDWMLKVNGIDIMGSANKRSVPESKSLSIYRDVCSVMRGIPLSKEAGGYISERLGEYVNKAGEWLLFAPDDWNWISNSLSKKYTDDELLESGMVCKRSSGRGVFSTFRNRVMFPIINGGGMVCGFSGRAIGDTTPKYMNSKSNNEFNKGELLLGLFQNRANIAKKKKVIIVEGNFDVVSLSVRGVDNVVAPLGTSLTTHQIRQLKKICDSAIMLFDGDDAGLEAAKKAVPLFLGVGMKASVVVLPGGYDPDSFVRENGAEQLMEMIADCSKDMFDFIVSEAVKKHGRTLSGQVAIMAELEPVINSAISQSQKDIMRSYVDTLLGVKTHGNGSNSLPPVDHRVEVPSTRKLSKIEEFALFYPEHRRVIDPTPGTRLYAICQGDTVEGVLNNVCADDIDVIREAISAGCGIKDTDRSFRSLVEIEDFLDGDSDSATLMMPEHLVRPGGLISLGMDGLSGDGLPKQWQLSFPVVLAVIGAAVCDKIRAAGTSVISYNSTIAVSGGGKSDIAMAMQEALLQVNLGDILGPNKFASGPAIVNRLSEQPNMLCFLDEITSYLSGTSGKERDLNGMTQTLLELYSLGGNKRGYESVYSNKENSKKSSVFYFSFVGNCTPNLFSALDQSSIGSGLIPRVNFFCYLGRLYKRGVWKGVSSDLVKFAEQLYFLRKRDNRDVDGNSRTFDLSIDAVRDMLDDVEEEILDTIGTDYKNNTTVSLCNKIFKDSLRYAMIHHAAMQPLHCLYDPIERESMKWGIDVSRSLTKWKIDKLVPMINYGDFDADCRLFMEGLGAANRRYLSGKEGKPTRKSIAAKRRATGNWTVQRWEQIIESLVMSGKISTDGNYIAPISE